MRTHRLTRACLVFAIGSLFAVPARAQLKNPEGVPVLILSGGQRQHHGYREQALYLSRTLEKTGRYRTTIVEDAAILESPALQNYQIVIGMADRRDPEFKMTEAQQKGLFEFVRSGHGYVSIHGADNAPPDWLPEWKDMLGGIYSHTGQPDGRAIMGTYTVKIADTSHPITQGLADFELKDELYSNMQMKDDVKPLATIDYKGVTWPVAWTYQYGKGYVFHTSLGHHGFSKPDEEDPLHDPNLTKLVVQGMDWIANELKANAEK
ncbi:MAG TPA: ThuA domain-containing protein [Isosphaeraceae bacterium]|nr:ThuA domain-containing protein [Isosphaeraceae bacterium]